MTSYEGTKLAGFSGILANPITVTMQRAIFWLKYLVVEKNILTFNFYHIIINNAYFGEIVGDIAWHVD
jgi:hypothetical protein